MNFDGRQEGLETPEFQLVPEVSLVVNDTRSSCRGAVVCVWARFWKIPLAGEEKHLDGALRQII